MDITTAVRTGREATANLRQIDRVGGGTMATVRAQERHAAALRIAETELTAAGRRDLAGALRTEDDLVQRIAASKANGIDRPELKSRLAATRKLLRSA